MQSPFFWRNLGVLLLVLANLALSVRLLLHGALPSPTPGPVAIGVILRGFALTYATLSLVAALIAILLFCILELLPESRATWTRSAKWSEIRPGMTPQEVIDLLGEPFQRSTVGDSSTGSEVQFGYQLHPLGLRDGAAVIFQAVPGAAMTVTLKSPDDESLARITGNWIPGGYTGSRYRGTITEAASILSFLGIMLLVVATMLPFGARAGASSWTLYIPLLALVLGLIYEARGPRGWRYDLMLLYPLYAIILIGWMVRLIPLLRGRA